MKLITGFLLFAFLIPSAFAVVIPIHFKFSKLVNGQFKVEEKSELLDFIQQSHFTTTYEIPTGWRFVNLKIPGFIGRKMNWVTDNKTITISLNYSSPEYTPVDYNKVDFFYLKAIFENENEDTIGSVLINLVNAERLDLIEETIRITDKRQIPGLSKNILKSLIFMSERYLHRKEESKIYFGLLQNSGLLPEVKTLGSFWIQEEDIPQKALEELLQLHEIRVILIDLSQYPVIKDSIIFNYLSSLSRTAL